MRGDFGRGTTRRLAHKLKKPALDLINYGCGDRVRVNHDSKAQPDFRKVGWRQSGAHARRDHLHDAAAPLFDKAKFFEGPRNDTIAQARDAFSELFHRETGQQDTGVLDLDPIFEYGDSDRCTTL